MKTVLNIWINYKANNPTLFAKYGILAFEYFVSTHSHLFEIYSINWVKGKYPQYF